MLPRIIVIGLFRISLPVRLGPRIIVIGLCQISLLVRLGPRQGVISLQTIEVVKEAEEGAEEEEEEEERAIEDLPTQALVVEMKKRRPSLVDCYYIPCMFTPIPAKHETLIVIDIIRYDHDFH